MGQKNFFWVEYLVLEDMHHILSLLQNIPNEDGETTRIIKGGKKSLVNTVEASIPLSQAAKMRLSFFLDYGIDR